MGYRPGIAMSCDVGHRCDLDLALLWLWCRPAATAPIRPLAWESLYAVGVGLKRTKRQNKQPPKTPPQKTQKMFTDFDPVIQLLGRFLIIRECHKNLWL